MKILEIYNNINPEDDVIFQSREIVKDLHEIDKDGSFIKVIANEKVKRESVNNSTNFLKRNWFVNNKNSNEWLLNDKNQLMGGNVEIINFLIIVLQEKIIKFISENKEFKSKKQFKNYCWKSLENKIIDTARKVARDKAGYINIYYNDEIDPKSKKAY